MNKKILSTAAALAATLALGSATAWAQTPIGTGNPYLPLWEHLPDGEPRVFEDPDNPGKMRAYIIGSHDVRYTDYCGADIRMWSAPVEDLTDWRDEGPIFTYRVDGQWDVMFAPDLVEIVRPDGTKEYYLYPHSRGPMREPMVCKGSRPDGPFTPVNLTADGRATVEGSILGFDPSIFVEKITDPADPDYKTGFRAYGFWGYQRSNAAELDPDTMYSVRPGTKVHECFIPASSRYGQVHDPEGTVYPALYEGQDPRDFNFYEASSIRQVGNKYVMIFSGYSGPDYGLGSTNSSLRYAYGDTPLGPWRSGGVLVDSRGIVLSEDGSHLVETNAAHNTHGSIEQIGGRWYAFYHRPPRGYGFARQAMVAPINIEWDEKPVAEGGKVTITAHDPYAKDGKWVAAASDGNVYMGAEVTSEGFQIYGLPPYRYYSAGYACYLSNIGAQHDSWDIWDNSMPVDFCGGDVVGYKYFGFGGLKKDKSGVPAFEGARRGNRTAFNLFLKACTDKAFTVEVWLDGPYANDVWKGRKIAEIAVPAGSKAEVGKYTVDVAGAVEGLKGKHAIYLKAGGPAGEKLCVLYGLGFSSKNVSLDYPAPPEVCISVDGNAVELPAVPVRFTAENGYTGYENYEAYYYVPAEKSGASTVSARCSDPEVKISIRQCRDKYGKATVSFDRKGVVKNYTLWLVNGESTATETRVVEDGGTGPYKAVMLSEAGLEAHTIFRPADMSVFSKPLPVIVWGNGACTNSPWEHKNFLNEIASYGYVVVATGYMPPEDGSPYQGPRSTSEQQIEGIDWAYKVNADPGSPYFGKLDLRNICAAGMSCGGLQTLDNAADPRLKTIMICNSGLFVDPAVAMPGMPMPHKERLKEIHTPVLYMLGGPEDIAYGNGMDDFSRIDHVLAVAVNYPVGHGGTYLQPHGGEFSVVALAWLDWMLKGSRSAAAMFLGPDPQILQRDGWTIEVKMNRR